jgi:hypothetical protein
VTLEEFGAKAAVLEERRKVLEADRRALALEASQGGILHAVICTVLRMGPATLVGLRRTAGLAVGRWGAKSTE